jgi:hypothetical protein
MYSNQSQSNSPARDEVKNDQDIGELIKNTEETLKLRLRTYKGHQFLDIRSFWKKDDTEFIPTKKGITIPKGKLKEFSKLIGKAVQITEGTDD